MLLSFVLAFGIVWMSARSKVVPYIVEVDKLGYAITIPAALNASSTPPSVERMKRYETQLKRPLRIDLLSVGGHSASSNRPENGRQPPSSGPRPDRSRRTSRSTISTTLPTNVTQAL